MTTPPLHTAGAARRRTRHPFAGQAMAAVAALSLSACATMPADPEARADYVNGNDPAEPANRKIFAGNQFVDRNALQPIARGYREYVPGRVRRSAGNFVSNLAQPGILVNDVLQGNVSRAWSTAQRFVINTTVGGAGLFDVATDWDRPGHRADFGQTLGVWGVASGPSVQLPLLGPSNVRDTVGAIGSLITNPVNLATGGTASAITATSGVLGVVGGRADLLGTTDEIEKSSLDYYATLRSISAQRRAAFIQEGREGRVRAQEEPAKGKRPLPTPGIMDAQPAP